MSLPLLGVAFDLPTSAPPSRHSARGRRSAPLRRRVRPSSGRFDEARRRRPTQRAVTLQEEGRATAPARARPLPRRARADVARAYHSPGTPDGRVRVPTRRCRRCSCAPATRCAGMCAATWSTGFKKLKNHFEELRQIPPKTRDDDEQFIKNCATSRTLSTAPSAAAQMPPPPPRSGARPRQPPAGYAGRAASSPSTPQRARSAASAAGR